MDEEIGEFALSKVFPLIFWVATIYFIASIIYIIYYFFVRKNYRYVEDHSKEQECLICTEANCSKKQNKYNLSEEYSSPSTLYNEKVKIKSNLDIIEDHLNNLKPNNIEEINDSTLNDNNEFKLFSSSKGTHKSSKSYKSYLSSMSNATYVNSDEERHLYNLLVGRDESCSSSSRSQNYQYGCYGSTKIYGGKVRSNKCFDDKYSNGYKSINKKNTKAYQNYVSFNNVFKERSNCTCECHNKEYNKIRVKFNTLDLVSKNNHEFLYWSFYICLQISALMIILYGVFSVFPN